MVVTIGAAETPALHVEHVFALQVEQLLVLQVAHALLRLQLLHERRQHRAKAFSVHSTVPEIANKAKRMERFMARCLSILDIDDELHQESSVDRPE